MVPNRNTNFYLFLDLHTVRDNVTNKYLSSAVSQLKFAKNLKNPITQSRH